MKCVHCYVAWRCGVLNTELDSADLELLPQEAITVSDGDAICFRHLLDQTHSFRERLRDMSPQALEAAYELAQLRWEANHVQPCACTPDINDPRCVEKRSNNPRPKDDR